jgi:hypothetical protein
MFSSCRKKFVCSAYYSYFILDTIEQTRRYGYFGDDSMPKKHIMDYSTRESNGLIARANDKRRNKQFKIVEMKMIIPKGEPKAKDSSDARLDSLVQSDEIPSSQPIQQNSEENF